MGGCTARRSRPVFRLETLRWNREIEAGSRSTELGQDPEVPGGLGRRLGWFRWSLDCALCSTEGMVHSGTYCYSDSSTYPLTAAYSGQLLGNLTGARKLQLGPRKIHFADWKRTSVPSFCEVSSPVSRLHRYLSPRCPDYRSTRYLGCSCPALESQTGLTRLAFAHLYWELETGYRSS